jgi:amino acid permease
MKIFKWIDDHIFAIGLFCLTINFISLCTADTITITARIAHFTTFLLFFSIYINYRITIRNMEYYKSYSEILLKHTFINDNDKDTYGK